MSEPIIQGQEFPVVEPTAAKKLEETTSEDDYVRVRTLDGATPTAASFQFDGEDHTLGNVLRYIIMKNPDVEFCGYSMPHPSEAKMNIRIQSYDNANVWDILEKALQDLMDMCDVVTDKFVLARDEHRAGKAKSADKTKTDKAESADKMETD